MISPGKRVLFGERQTEDFAELEDYLIGWRVSQAVYDATQSKVQKGLESLYEQQMRGICAELFLRRDPD